MRIEEALARAKRLYGPKSTAFLVGDHARGCFLLGASGVVTSVYQLEETFTGGVSLNVERARAAAKSLNSGELLQMERVPGGLVFHGDAGRAQIAAETLGQNIPPPDFSSMPWVPFDSWPQVRSTLHSITEPKEDRPAFEAVRAAGGEVWATDGAAVTCAHAPEFGVEHTHPLLPGAALRGVPVASTAELVDAADRVTLRFDHAEVRIVLRTQGWFPDTVKTRASWPAGVPLIFEATKLAHASLEAQRAAKKYLEDHPGKPPMVELHGEPGGLRVLAGGFSYLVEIAEGYVGRQTRAWRFDPTVFHEAVRAHRQVANNYQRQVALCFGAADADPLLLYTPGLSEAIYPIRVVEDVPGV